MAYVFDTQIASSMRSSVTGAEGVALLAHNMAGINGREQDANIIMGGLSLMYGIVGWEVQESTRTVKQDVSNS